MPEPEEEACPTLPCEFSEGTWERCVEDSAGAELGTRKRTPNITRPSSGGGTACPPIEFEPCVVQGPALCSTIKDHNTFCKNAGDNGLNPATQFKECQGSFCTETDDADLCCKPSEVAATCNTIPNEDRNAFCEDYGDNGLVDDPQFASCKTTTCKSSLDGITCCRPAPAEGEMCDTLEDTYVDFCPRLGSTGLVDDASNTQCASGACTEKDDLYRCCKPCPSGKYVKSREGGNEGNNTCHACDIGQNAPVGANKCEPYCPAGYGALKNVPIYVNVMLMLDKTGSIQGEWASEINASKAYCELVPLSFRLYFLCFLWWICAFAAE